MAMQLSQVEIFIGDYEMSIKKCINSMYFSQKQIWERKMKSKKGQGHSHYPEEIQINL